MVAYKYDEHRLEANSPENQVVGNDSFTFAVTDACSNYSVKATINMTMFTGVWALPMTDKWICYEDTDCTVYLYGDADMDEEVHIYFNITGIPTLGELIDAGGINNSVGIGYVPEDNLSYPYDDGVGLTYQPAADFFNSPTVTWNGTQLESTSITISYHALVTLGDAILSSAIETQDIKVVNVDDSSTVVCPTSEYTLDGALYSIDHDPTEDRPDAVYLYGFEIEDKDRGVDPIRMDIYIEEGWISLDSNSSDALNMRMNCDSNTEFYCTGDGHEDDDVILKAQPVDVVTALNGMLYASFYDEISDQMNITMYDGAGSVCIADFRTYSVRTECVMSRCEIPFTVGAYYWPDEDEYEHAQIYGINVTLMNLLYAALLFGVAFGWAICLATKVLRSLCRLGFRVAKYFYCRMLGKGNKSKPRDTSAKKSRGPLRVSQRDKRKQTAVKMRAIPEVSSSTGNENVDRGARKSAKIYPLANSKESKKFFWHD